MTGRQRSRPEVTAVRPAGDDAQVVTIVGGHGGYRRRPCAGCPWRVDATGDWPAEAFRHSAETAHDMSTRTFGCHDSGAGRPSTCAGFLLRGADHNLAVRLATMNGDVDLDAVSADVDLHADYVAMATANGVPAGDPALAACRRGHHALPEEDQP